MISHKHRFHGLGSVRRTYKDSRVVRGEHCSLRYKAHPKRKEYRVAVVISKKTEKSAVKRNRMRRRIYEYIRNNQHLFTTQADMVITVYSDQVATMSHTELAAQLNSLLKKAHIL